MNDPALDIDYGELIDALGWIAEAPFLTGTDEHLVATVIEQADVMIAAAKKLLYVEPQGLWEFLTVGLTNVLVGDFGLGPDLVNELLGKRERELLILVGIAAARGKCPGP